MLFAPAAQSEGLEFRQNQSSSYIFLFLYYRSAILLFFYSNRWSMNEVQNLTSLAILQIQQTSFFVLRSTIQRSQSSCILIYIFLLISSIQYFLLAASSFYSSTFMVSAACLSLIMSISFSSLYLSTSSTSIILSASKSSSSCMAITFLVCSASCAAVCSYSLERAICLFSSVLYFQSDFWQRDSSCLYFQCSLRCYAESKNWWSISNFELDCSKTMTALLSLSMLTSERMYSSTALGSCCWQMGSRALKMIAEMPLQRQMYELLRNISSMIQYEFETLVMFIVKDLTMVVNLLSRQCATTPISSFSTRRRASSLYMSSSIFSSWVSRLSRFMFYSRRYCGYIFSMKRVSRKQTWNSLQKHRRNTTKQTSYGMQGMVLRQAYIATVMFTMLWWMLSSRSYSVSLPMNWRMEQLQVLKSSWKMRLLSLLNLMVLLLVWNFISSNSLMISSKLSLSLLSFFIQSSDMRELIWNSRPFQRIIAVRASSSRWQTLHILWMADVPSVWYIFIRLVLHWMQIARRHRLHWCYWFTISWNLFSQIAQWVLTSLAGRGRGRRKVAERRADSIIICLVYAMGIVWVNTDMSQLI